MKQPDFNSIAREVVEMVKNGDVGYPFEEGGNNFAYARLADRLKTIYDQGGKTAQDKSGVVICDEYGDKQVYLVQPTKLDYEIPNSDPIALINEGRFRTYYTCNERGVRGGLRIQLNRIGAESLAKANNLKLITDVQQDELLK